MTISVEVSQAGAFIPNQGRIAAPKAAATLCATYRWACAKSNRARSPELGKISAVNRKINRSTREISDDAQYRREDHWALPSRRGGDCEDFALLKKRELIGMGYAPDRLLLTTVLDRAGRPHAVLVARTENGDFVVDNLRDTIKPWNKTGYTFLRMQDPSAPHRWVSLNVKG
ncbi:transglutaminase-like cysteine peptidase [Aliiruegeria lutimaris]|nr:transglutaminase-like cysteine peptidase [Aliiruegeria lutimaris]